MRATQCGSGADFVSRGLAEAARSSRLLTLAIGAADFVPFSWKFIEARWLK